MALNSHWINTLIIKLIVYFCVIQLLIYGSLVIYSYFTYDVKIFDSGNETDIDSGNESDFEDEIPKAPAYSPRREIMPGARIRMMRR